MKKIVSRMHFLYEIFHILFFDNFQNHVIDVSYIYSVE